MATETAVDVVMPQMGVSVSEGTITRWLKQEGEHVEADEPLLEISTDKVDTEVPSPASGTLTQIVVQEGQTVEVGTMLAQIGGEASGDGQAAAPPEPAPPEPATAQAAAESAAAAGAEGETPTAEPIAEAEPAAPAPAAAPAGDGAADGKSFVPTSTVWPSCTRICVTVPLAGEGTSVSTLSVEISSSGSSASTCSPSRFNHFVIVPSETETPICGITTSTAVSVAMALS